MTRSTMNIARGVGIAVALGATVGVVGSCIAASSGKKTMKRRMHHAADRVGDFVDNMTCWFSK